MRERLPIFILALWWGSLCALGLWIVPLLFKHLPAASLAGSLAARLFTAQTWVGLLCGVLLLLSLRKLSPTPEPVVTGLVLAAMILALMSEAVVAPRILARENLAFWHGLGSAIYLAQWGCVSLAFWRRIGLKN